MTETDNKISIRDAEFDDVRAIALMIEDIERYYGASIIDGLDARIAQTADALFGSPPLANAVLAVDEAGVLVGLAAYSFLWPAAGATHSLFLKELYVADDHRRTGLATQLLEHLKTIARSRPGCSRLEWTTDSDNPAALAFYDALGYSINEGKAWYRWSVD